MNTRIFFATDIHGSETCWKKFINAGRFYKASTLILGGDMTGKAIIPLICNGANFETSFLGKKLVYPAEKVEELEKIILDKGCYPCRTNREEVREIELDVKKRDALFLDTMIHTLGRWMKIADEHLKNTNIKCFVCPGNDDAFEIDSVIEESESVMNAGNKVIEIENCFEMVSLGWTNLTPWRTFRECNEEELHKKILNLVSQVINIKNSIFNFHAPPYGSGLDLAPEIDKTLKQTPRIFVPVGSTAVEDAIKQYQPLVGLHGHIHESSGFTKIGRTMCFNPGSSYDRGILLGVLISLDEKHLKCYLPVVG